MSMQISSNFGGSFFLNRKGQGNFDSVKKNKCLASLQANPKTKTIAIDKFNAVVQARKKYGVGVNRPAYDKFKKEGRAIIREARRNTGNPRGLTPKERKAMKAEEETRATQRENRERKLKNIEARMQEFLNQRNRRSAA